MNLRPWQQNSTKAARKLVLSIMNQHKDPISTQQMFKLVVEKELEKGGIAAPPRVSSASTSPPHPTHAIRSMSYLKNVVFPDLVRRREVEKIHSIRNLTPEEVEQRLKSMTKAARRSAELTTTAQTWSWQRRTPPPLVTPKPSRQPFGTEVGVGEDWSHLNKRRQGARAESVGRDRYWMRQLEKARSEGVTATSNTS